MHNTMYCVHAGPPSAPRNPSASDVTNTTVFLQWESPLDDGNRSDLFYTISHNICNISYNANGTSYLLENLIPFVDYEIYITADNGVSSQDPSTVNRSTNVPVMTKEGGKYSLYVGINNN